MILLHGKFIKNLLIRCGLWFVIFVVLFHKPVHNLALFDAAMSNRCNYGIPILEIVLLVYLFLILRL